jgi:hypothetical protein
LHQSNFGATPDSARIIHRQLLLSNPQKFESLVVSDTGNLVSARNWESFGNGECCQGWVENGIHGSFRQFGLRLRLEIGSGSVWMGGFLNSRAICVL